jgi:hypothetical protein
MGQRQTAMTPAIVSDERSSREIEQDIRERRDQMDATLDELGERLTLRSLVESAFKWWDAPGGGVGGAGAKRACLALGRQIKTHPMPSLLIGSGVAWLLSEAAGEDDHWMHKPSGISKAKDAAVGAIGDAKDAAAGAIGDAKDKVVEVAEKIHDKADHLAHDAMARSRDTARNVGHQLAEGYRTGAEKFSRAADEYPLAIGAAFAALGVLVGLSLPHTRKEDELRGEQSDHLVDAAKEKGEQLLEAGKAIGERLVDAAKDEAAGQGLIGGPVQSEVAALGKKAAEVIGRVKEEAIEAVHDEVSAATSEKPEDDSSAKPASGSSLG